MLCGGRLRSRSSARPAPRASRSLSRRSTAMTPRYARLRASEGADLDGDGRRDRAVEARVDVVGANLTHRFGNLEIAPVEIRAELLLHRRTDTSGSQRAVQATLRAGLGFDHDRLCLETALELTGAVFFLRGVLGRGRLQIGDLLERGVRRRDGQPARDEEVTRVPIRDLFDLAGAGNVGD